MPHTPTVYGIWSKAPSRRGTPASGSPQGAPVRTGVFPCPACGGSVTRDSLGRESCPCGSARADRFRRNSRWEFGRGEGTLTAFFRDGEVETATRGDLRGAGGVHLSRGESFTLDDFLAATASGVLET